MADLHNWIPVGVWFVTQLVKVGFPALERTVLGKSIFPVLAVALGVMGGGLVDHHLVDVMFPSLMQAVTNAGYGLIATGAHEVGEAVKKVVKGV